MHTDTATLEARFEAELGPLVATLLGVVGPMPTARITAVLQRAGHFAPLVAEGYDDGDLHGLVEWVVDDEQVFFATGDDLVAHVPTLLDGVVLTHQVTASEIDREVLDLGVDLAALVRCCSRLPLLGGGCAEVRHDWGARPALAQAAIDLGLPTDARAAPEGSLVGPPGWLGGIVAGAHVAAGGNGGTLAVVPVADPAAVTSPHPALVEAIAAAAERRRLCADEVDGGPTDVLLDALAHDPTLLRAPAVPLSLVLGPAGLLWDGDTLRRARP
ncbi:MAG: hypothetical protein JNK12_08085 [Acidimicrobiales bacterium]|nr:hypothetical protein [Acidimicrobiales bacterium]